MRNKVVVITGASSGIGKALAQMFAAKGARLALGARNTRALEELAQALENQHGTKPEVVPCDVTQQAECRVLVERAVARFGKIDVLINNAGISMRAPVQIVDAGVLHALMDTNFWGTVYCTQAALPHLIGAKGSVVGVSSIAGIQGLPERSGYSASKFAMHGFLESLRIEMMPHGVHVLLACPGFTASNIRERALTADGNTQGHSPRDEARMMTAEAVAGHIYQAIVGRRRTLILTRQGKLTVLIKKLFPAWLERQVFKTFEKERAWEAENSRDSRSV